MKNEVIDVASISIEGRKVLFDANIWIIINGFCGKASGPRLEAYSNAYDRLLKKNNKIVVNDYVLGEFSNRCARFEYDLAKRARPTIGLFKEYRQSPEFLPKMKLVRDTCLDIVKQCEFIPVGRAGCNVVKAIEEFCMGKLDFSDVILTQHCVNENCYLMTDDADFGESGLGLITWNKKLIRRAKAN